MPVRRIECEKQINLKREEANNAPKARAAQLQTDLNKLEGNKAVEYLRSTNFAKTTVEAESAAKACLTATLHARTCESTCAYAATPMRSSSQPAFK